jgi:hypothetical protein
MGQEMNDEERAARLLRGKNTPSVLERESMVGQILDDVSPKRARVRWFRSASMIVAVGAAATALIFMVRPPDEMTPRAGESGAALETICRPGPACKRGSQLLFRVSNVSNQGGYLAAFAKRADGLVIWYFPRDESASSTAFSQNQWLDEGVILGADHEPGEYRIYALISKEPLARDRIRELIETGGEEQHELLQGKVKVTP